MKLFYSKRLNYKFGFDSILYGYCKYSFSGIGTILAQDDSFDDLLLYL